MRKTAIISFATGAIALTLLVLPRPAQAMTLTAPSRIAAAIDTMVSIERVRDCARTWDGYQWQSQCREARPRHHYRYSLRSRLWGLRWRLRHYWRYF
jgi:hypothetical protein